MSMNETRRILDGGTGMSPYEDDSRMDRGSFRSDPPGRCLSPSREEQSQIASLVHVLYHQYGFDFRDYSHDALWRRIRYRMESERVGSISALKERVLNDSVYTQSLVSGFSIGVTAMFRDPRFFLAFRRKVVPLLRDLSFIRIWHAGCATGEEVYSMAILLQEEGVYEKARLYATDINCAFLRKAKEGIFPLGKMKAYTRNYMMAGGRGSFSDHYVAGYGGARFASALAGNIVFSRFDLAAGHPFNEFNAILCRNVLIYFNNKLQNRVIGLFHQSLTGQGILGLGDTETIRTGPHRGLFEEIDAQNKLFRKTG
jgi:chemotaxis protein methyltransferase CheR